jgi:hypothetical protein
MLNQELEKSRNFSVVILIVALLTVYGGTTLPFGEGVWFNYNVEFKGTDNGEPEFEFETAFLLDEAKLEGKTKEAFEDNSESVEEDAKYSEDGFEEREDLMEFTKNLALLTIIIAGVLLAFIFGFLNGQFGKEKVQEYLDYSKNLCLGLIVICLLNAGNFALNYSEAWQEDVDEGMTLDTLCGTKEGDEIPMLVTFLGKCNNKNTDQIIAGVTGDVEASWHPGLAWFSTLLLIPSLAFLQLHRLKTLEEIGAFSEYKPAPKKKRRVSKKQQPQVQEGEVLNVQKGEVLNVQEGEVLTSNEAVSKPSKVAKKKKPLKFKAKIEQVDIECPSCSEIMKVPKLNKLQDVKCKACGLSGEIEV